MRRVKASGQRAATTALRHVYSLGLVAPAIAHALVWLVIGARWQRASLPPGCYGDVHSSRQFMATQSPTRLDW
jgi:hypothetical protein